MQVQRGSRREEDAARWTGEDRDDAIAPQIGGSAKMHLFGNIWQPYEHRGAVVLIRSRLDNASNLVGQDNVLSEVDRLSQRRPIPDFINPELRSP